MTKPPYHRQNLAAAIQQQARQQLLVNQYN